VLDGAVLLGLLWTAQLTYANAASSCRQVSHWAGPGSCVCGLVPLFDVQQPTVSHHLKVPREADIVGSERQGLWACYYTIRDGLEGAVRMAELSDTRDSPRER
jgi:DNA-binding transcriptional ArsR family regulator